jgi:hypothetical protein
MEKEKKKRGNEMHLRDGRDIESNSVQPSLKNLVPLRLIVAARSNHRKGWTVCYYGSSSNPVFVSSRNKPAELIANNPILEGKASLRISVQ